MNKLNLHYESPTVMEFCAESNALLCTSNEKFTVESVGYDIYEGGDF